TRRRQIYSCGNRRMADGPANSRRRTRNHVERSIPSRSDAGADSHCWRWLYRPRVCGNLPWIGRASHDDPSRRDLPARIRRRFARRTGGRDAQARNRPALRNPRQPNRPGRRRRRARHAHPRRRGRCKSYYVRDWAYREYAWNGLEDAGVMLDGAGAIVVDRYSHTSAENIYAIGDVTNRKNLTPVAIAEGRAVAETLFGKRAMSVDYNNVPSAVFSQPTIGTVGLTEAEARQRFGEIDLYTSKFRPLKHTLSGSDELTFMKLIVDRKTDRVVGCHMMGTDAGEIIQGFAVALQCGATKAQFDATIGIHPTAAEEFVTMREKAPA